MPHFTATEARAIIREKYTSVSPSNTAIADAIYDPAVLAMLPRGAVELALGVGDTVCHARLQPGEVVLDVGCGGGIDTLLAALAVGSQGRVIGLDMTDAMVEKARAHAAAMGLENVEIRQGLMEELPLPDASVDVVLCNGVLNLSTRKSRALAEMMRVLRPGGRVTLAELIRTEALPEEVLKSPAALAG